jgi:Ca2+-binding EF-hand superfamily protein
MKSAGRLIVLVLAVVLAAFERASAENPGSPAWHSAAPADAQDILFFGPLRPLLVRLRITNDGKPFRDAWQARFDELFASEDRDHRGRVTVEQGESIARDMNGSLRENIWLEMKKIAEPDGLVERAALSAYIEKVFPPFVIRRRASIARDSAAALFPLLDINHDNQLSTAELAAAVQQLKQRDFNDDGVITAGELILDPKAIAAAADSAGAQPESNSDDGQVVALDAAMTREQIADKLLNHYDRDNDDRLTTRPPNVEIGLPQALLAKLDANGDGALNREELMGFADRRPDLELPFAMGRVTAAELRKQQPVSTDDGFRVRKRLRDGYHLDLGDSVVDFQRNGRDPRQADLVDLKSYDRDNNGYIDASEAANNNISKSAFAAMDTDGDGKVFKGEFTSYVTRQNAAAAMRLLLEVTDKGQDLFAILDTDGDGVLSAREQHDAKNVLSFADKNGDGALAGDELPQKLDFTLLRGADELREEAIVGQRRATRSAAKAGTLGPLWFRKMDRNNDGDVSL